MKPVVLVIDDQREILVLVSRLLTKLGYQALAVPTEVEARQVLKEHPVDVVVCDLQLGESDSLDFLQNCLNHQPHLKVLLTSGALPPESATYPFLPKPFSGQQLHQALQQLVE